MLTGRKGKGRLNGLTAKSFETGDKQAEAKGRGAKTAQRVHWGLELEREARGGDSIHKTARQTLYTA